MKLISMIAASVLSSSLALGAAADTVQTPSKKPVAAPTAQPPVRAYAPDMTQMPKSYLEATILYRQNGQALFVDTSGNALPLSQAGDPHDATAPQMQLQTPMPNGKQPSSGFDLKSLKPLILTPERMTLSQGLTAPRSGQSCPDPQISHWLTPASPMTSNEIH